MTEIKKEEAMKKIVQFKQGIVKCPTLDYSRFTFWIVLVLVLTTSQGYCAGAELQEMDVMTNTVMNMIFSPWVKKTALVFGGGMGLFQAYGAGSVKPLLLWGGLGLAVNYVPKIVEVIAKM